MGVYARDAEKITLLQSMIMQHIPGTDAHAQNAAGLST